MSYFRTQVSQQSHQFCEVNKNLPLKTFVNTFCVFLCVAAQKSIKCPVIPLCCFVLYVSTRCIDHFLCTRMLKKCKKSIKHGLSLVLVSSVHLIMSFHLENNTKLRKMKQNLVFCKHLILHFTQPNCKKQFLFLWIFNMHRLNCCTQTPCRRVWQEVCGRWEVCYF